MKSKDKMRKPIDVVGASGGGSQPAQHTPAEAENTLRSTSIYRVLDLIAEGEIEGWSTGSDHFGQSVLINEVPLQSPDGTFNFKGITVAGRAGSPGQPPMGAGAGEELLGGFPDGIPVLVSINRNFTMGQGGPEALMGPYQSTILGETDLDFIQIIVAVDALWRQETNGDTNGESVTFQYEIQAQDTHASTNGMHTINGKCMSTYQRALRLPAPVSATGDYIIRLTRLTGDFPSTVAPGSVKQHGTLSIVGYTLIRDRKMEYPDCAYVLGVADARLFGSTIPKRAYKIKGLKVSVPNGYTPPVKNADGTWTAATYPTIWDGQMRPLVYTSNPAWCTYDFLTNDRYGAGLPDIQGMLKTALYPIGKYCDELIDDGFGGLEPRFTLNYAITSQSEAYTLINSLISVFRGMCWWGAGSVIVSQDSPNAGDSSIAQMLVTPANVIDGVFTYEGSALKARHSTIMVTWNDPHDHGRPTIEYVEDRETLLRYGLRPKESSAIGCTSRGQAHRVGKWTLDSEKTETEVVKYSAGLDHAFIAPGMIIAVADPFYQTPPATGITDGRDPADLNRMGGRIVSATASQIVLDNPVTLAAGISSYTISFLTGEATQNSVPKIVDVSVNVGATGTEVPVTVIELVSELPTASIPVPGAIWIISANNYNVHQSSRLYRVMSIVENDGIYEIAALQHDPNKYARVEQDLNLAPTVWDTYAPSPILAAPPTTSVTLITKFINNVFQNALLFAWEASPDGRVVNYRVEWRVSTSAALINGTWAAHSLDGPAHIELSNLALGYYEFRVRAEAGTGLASTWKEASFQLDANTLSAVSNLHLVNNEGLGRETMFVGADIRIAWEDGDVVGEGTAVTDYVYLIEVNGVFTYETPHLEFTYSLFMNSSDNGGVPQRTVTFTVYKKKPDGAISDTSASIEVQNAPPSMAGFSPTLTAGFKSVNIDWSNWSTDDSDLIGFKILCDTHNPPTIVRDTIGPTHTGWAVRELDALQEYFVQIMPIDAFGEGIPSTIPSACAPTILAGVDVNIELRDSVLVTDSLDSTQEALLPLFDRDRFGAAMTYSGAGTKWIQYAYNIENYIDQVILYATTAGLQFFVSYSVDGETWSYLAGDVAHSLTSENVLTPAANATVAASNYWLTEGRIAQAVFPQRITAKFCRLHVLGNQTAALQEVMFVREVIAEQIVADNLSAISANLGTVVTGEIISSNYSPGVAGMYVNVAAGAAEFNDITFTFTDSSRGLAQDALNVEDGATNGAPTGSLVAGTQAQTLVNTANTAATNAAAAVASILEISNDNILTPDEKPRVLAQRDVIVTEQAGIDATAATYGISSEKTAYDSAVTALTTYLATLTSPVAWTNVAGNTTIVGGTFQAKFNTVYTTRQTLLNKIASVAGTTANWSGVTGTGRPSDYADSTAGALNSGLDTTTGGVIVRQAGTNGDYAHLWSGDLDFMRWTGTTYELRKSVTKTVAGVCANGDVINIGYYKNAPQIMLSPANMKTYDYSYYLQDQMIALNAVNITRTSNGTYTFQAECSLKLENGVTTFTPTIGTGAGSGATAVDFNYGTWQAYTYGGVQSASSVPSIRQVTVPVGVTVGMCGKRDWTTGDYYNYYVIRCTMRVSLGYSTDGGATYTYTAEQEFTCNSLYVNLYTWTSISQSGVLTVTGSAFSTTMSTPTTSQDITHIRLRTRVRPDALQQTVYCGFTGSFSASITKMNGTTTSAPGTLTLGNAVISAVGTANYIAIGD